MNARPLWPHELTQRFPTRWSAAVQSLLEEACAGALPDWLEKRRWFADKGRGISGMAIEDALVERVGLDWLALAVARVAFVDGGAARYFLPLMLTESPGDAHIITGAASDALSGVIVDATEKQWFGGWLLDQFGGVTELARGAWVFAARPGVGAEIAAARNSPMTAVRAEQSNSSLRFGDILIVKLFRRLQPGVNPDEEVLRALAGVRFERVPRYVGSICWRSPDDATYAVALAQEFVANTGDGWTWMLQRLAEVASGGSTRGLTSLPRSGCWAGEPASFTSPSARSRTRSSCPRRPIARPSTRTPGARSPRSRRRSCYCRSGEGIYPSTS